MSSFHVHVNNIYTCVFVSYLVNGPPTFLHSSQASAKSHGLKVAFASPTSVSKSKPGNPWPRYPSASWLSLVPGQSLSTCVLLERTMSREISPVLPCPDSGAAWQALTVLMIS